jgi:hypothetical protein
VFDMDPSVFRLGFMYDMSMDGHFGSRMDKPEKGFRRFGIS